MLRPFLAALACCAPLAAQAFDLQGHRGARGLAPENTLPAFALALLLGVSTLELDVRVTRDGVVVVHHDRTLHPDIARGPDGRWLERHGPAIRTLDYAELLRYDVGRLRPGSDYARPFPAQQAADGARVPKLSEVFALARKAGNGAVRFSIETKISPQAPEETPPPAQFARALGLKVVVWTVNEPEQIAAMLDVGVDGIISDRPDRVREEIKRRGIALPAATPVAF